MESSFGIAAVFAKRSTPAERLVIIWLLIIAAVAISGFCFYLGLTAPADKAVEAARLRWYGFGFFGFAILIWIVHRIIAWMLDR